MSAGRGGSNKKDRNKRTEVQKRRLNEQPARTEANRKRKWRKHLKKHPNHIKGMEHIRKALGMT